jgi:Legume lectin domain
MPTIKTILLCLIAVSAHAQISCGSGFTSSGACSLSAFPGSATNIINSRPPGSVNLSGSTILLIPTSCDHCAATMFYGTLQDITHFTTSFQFTPNDSAGLAFAIQNVTINNNGTGYGLVAGASGEMGLAQFCCSGGPNNIFYIKFDRFYGNLTQLTLQMQCPSTGTGGNCNETYGQSLYNALLPLQYSISPVNLASNGPYTATLTYDSQNFCMTIVDSAGTPNSYSQCWKVNIPGIVGGNTAYVGFGSSTGLTNTYATTMNTWTFSSGSPTLNATVVNASAAGSFR